MEKSMWISWIIGVYSVIFLGLLLNMKKTDPMIGCEKWRIAGCDKVSGSDCRFPDCEILKMYRSRGGNV